MTSFITLIIVFILAAFTAYYLNDLGQRMDQMAAILGMITRAMQANLP